MNDIKMLLRVDTLANIWCMMWIVHGISGSGANDLPLVQTSLGKISGFYMSSFGGRVFSAFEGIPYAKPPVGDLRFEPPQPVLPWKDVLNANARYTCKQVRSFFWYDTNASEDCLYLNVYVPKKQPTESDNYDVIVYVHGGAFMVGAPSFGGPKYLMDRDIIFVNMNYRLGVFGFLTTEDSVVPGNNGLKDQQLALKWVQEHIKDFGGNPRSVTLMGLSAGGASVHFHFFSPQSKGLFHRGISQSGTVLMPWATQESGLEKARKLAKSLNCQISNSTRTLINCLKASSADDLIVKTRDFYDLDKFPLAPFAPTVEVESESAFLTKHPYKQLEDGDVLDVPWLTWITTDEGILGAMFLVNILDETDKNWNEWSEHMFDYKHVCEKSKKQDIAQKIKEFYFQNETVCESNIKSLIKVFGDRLFNVGFETAVHMQADAVESPIYAAIFAFNKSTATKKVMGFQLEGVAHSAEGVLLHELEFLESPIKLTEPEVLMKDVLIDFVTSFAKNGKPESIGVNWEPLSTENPKYLFINDSDAIQMVKIPELSPKGFWENLNFMENKQAERLRDEL
ncbi:hypothetical protein PPYR_06204 [Photinus pyralis]|uniref:Carboxylic ester hydrolase n=3 Tax=Photinus pyralis TaxID=7054 RepID=A0A5N4ASZ2_PHOPY|nr:venom carboxylesterase-6-like [Photinus pyralis]XP_031337936.1 venom carboxylesterase-6-like [Photinus pyralis]XP_031337937.1 venom carboxylesterase-6-like [Photinus pyralis]KAB0800464.1 hypothetical protein PPYR_06204 [Photinus pyralis]